jgi:hypothetical protein
MLMGLFNAMATVVLLFAIPLTFPLFLFAAAIGASYFACMLLAPIFPGTAWSDPEFVNPKPLGLPVQQFLSLVGIGLVVVAVAYASVTD